MSLTTRHIMTEEERMSYLVDRQKTLLQSELKCWSPPALTEEEKEAQDAYILKYNLPF